MRWFRWLMLALGRGPAGTNPPAGDPRHELGRAGERTAARYLKRKKWRIRATRYSTPVGELDLIAEDGTTIVFVEIKTRTDRDWAEPEDSVTLEKQRRLTRAARWYLHHERLDTRPARFDVVSVVQPAERGVPASIEHFEEAFLPTR